MAQSKLFERPIDMSYNADFHSLQKGIEALMDKVEEQAEEIDNLKKARKAPADKPAPIKKPADAKKKAASKKK